PNSPKDPHPATILASDSRRTSRSPYNVVEANPMEHPLFRELRQAGLIKVLAEPTLGTASGRPASMLSGGQFPIKIKTSDGRIDTRWMTFGIQLNVTPVVLAGNRVRLQTRLEISEKDDRNAVVVEGDRIPALSSRSVQVETEMHFEQ